MSQAIILFAHGARDPEWAQPFERLRAALLALTPGMKVELAYLELMQPDLAAAVDALAAAGATAISVVPVFMAQGGHLKRDLPQRVEQARAKHPAIGFSLQPAIGEAQAIIDAMAAHIAAQAQTPPGQRG
ncbi:MAG TPA: CbiX/SirB N-terminal domain-containing protein [Burkholderiales bacterium]|jgi:sirohydrochlorin cobaltochelatase|nr:CbiX/SirB N-terminal domain-containing protein [Burkholderiales bacterium]